MTKQYVGTFPIETYTRDEAKADLAAAMGHQLNDFVREQVRGVKPLKLPVLTATASGTSLLIPASGGADPVACGPQQGYFWRIGRITVTSSGTDTGAVSLFASSDPTATIQNYLIDNTLKVGQAYYPGNRGLYLWPGEQLYALVTSVANNTYRLAGMAVEVPAEMAGKILV